MRRSALALALASCMLATHAQKKTENAQVEWGPELNAKQSGVFDEMIGQDQEAIYQLVRFKKKEVHVQKMDLSMHVVYHRPLELELDKKDLELEGVELIADRIVVFASYFNKKNDENNLYMRMYMASDLSPLGPYDKIARIPAEKRSNKGAFSLHSSPDGEKIMVEVEKPRMKQGRERFGVKVFDNRMSALWENDIDLPYLDNEFRRESLRLDNDGSLLLLGVKYSTKNEFRERKRADQATYDYHLLVYRKDTEAPEDFTIAVKEKFLQDMTISLGRSTDDIVCAGFYSDQGTWGIKGPYYLSLDRATKRIKHESFGAFDHDFITKYMTDKEERKAEKKAKKKDQELGIEWDYDLHDIIRNENGGVVLLAEQYYMYVVQSCSTSPNGGRSCSYTYHYIYNDIIAVSVDPAGNIEWSAKVPKRQHTTNDNGRYSSYAVEVKGDRIYLIFGDNGGNLFLKPGDQVKQFTVGKDALVTIATIDGEGNVTREALFTPEKREVILRPKDCLQLSDDRMFIYASRKSEYRFGLITFQ